MNKTQAHKLLILISIFIKEQSKEPIALFWIMFSPGVLFYIAYFSGRNMGNHQNTYIEAASWFYAYIASCVALFGFSLYLVGRRESGFTRSFIYKNSSRRLFLTAHYLAYSLISLVYCTGFYLMTRFPFGAYDMKEYGDLLVRFYTCYMLFCIPGLLFSLLPINFQTASTTLSMLSFCMLVLGAMSASSPDITPAAINLLNPMLLARNLMLEGGTTNWITLSVIVTLLALAFYAVSTLFRTHPVWSRY